MGNWPAASGVLQGEVLCSRYNTGLGPKTLPPSPVSTLSAAWAIHQPLHCLSLFLPLGISTLRRLRAGTLATPKCSLNMSSGCYYNTGGVRGRAQGVVLSLHGEISSFFLEHTRVRHGAGHSPGLPSNPPGPGGQQPKALSLDPE